MKKLATLVLSTLVILTFSSCATIKIYMVDRQTVLEDEAAGEWPDFEKEILQKSEASGATPFPVVAENSSRSRLFNVLNGELASTQAPVNAPAKTAPTVKPAGK